jgi:hypothetical protein
LAYYIERKNVGALILPPLVILALFNFATGGLAPFLLAEDIFSNEVTPILTKQIVDTSTFLLLSLVYWRINKKTPAMVVLEHGGISASVNNNRLRFVSYSLILFTVALHYVEIVTGFTDRGYAGSGFVDNPYGFWSYFNALSKLQYIAYMLIPYVCKTSNRIVRMVLIPLFVIYIFYEAANSARGAVIFPLILVVLGYWLIGGSFKRTFFSLLVLASVSVFLVPMLGVFRGSGALEITDLKDLPGRLTLLRESQRNYSEISRADGVDVSRVLGRALLGVTDPLVYADTPSLIPFAGWERISDVLYIWMPSMFFPEKPSLLDGNLISSQYTGVFYERSSIGIRLQADLYRRFGWTGVIFGYFVYAVLLSLFVRYAFQTYSNPRKRIWGVVVILFIAGFVRGAPSGTLLETMWVFLYDYPKYLIVLGLLVYVSGFYAKMPQVSNSLR